MLGRVQVNLTLYYGGDVPTFVVVLIKDFNNPIPNSVKK